MALAASLSTTAGLATWIAYGEGAFEPASADAEAAGTGAPAGSVGEVSDQTAAVPTDTSAVSDTGTVEPTDTSAVADTETVEPTDASTAAGTETVEPTDASAVADAETVEPTVTVATDDTTEAGDDTADTGRTVTVAFADGTFLGSAEYTEWGDVQVEVTIVGGELVDVVTVQLPDGRRSTPINERAVPLLEAEAVASQTADLDIVTGATYTSTTYADSLQAALDQAALAAPSQGIAA